MSRKKRWRDERPAAACVRRAGDRDRPFAQIDALRNRRIDSPWRSMVGVSADAYAGIDLNDRWFAVADRAFIERSSIRFVVHAQLKEHHMQVLPQEQVSEVAGGISGVGFIGFLLGYSAQTASRFYGDLPVGTIL